MLFNITAAFRRVTDITPEMLKEMGIKGLILDIDNTLAGHNNPLPAKGVVEWLDCMKQNDIRLVILSNNFYFRVKMFAELLGLDYISDAKKPFKRSYQLAAMKMRLPRHAMAAVGDQIFTDVLGANLFDIKVLYTEPIGNPSSVIHRIRRRIEAPFLPEKIYCKQQEIEYRQVKTITYKDAE
ncbi:MAG: YqeG family HAD IIIA-type phosphatase [Ruminococcus flavefaciens]|nr:YqeG family HAD IIIA-type phosphatase [Ruminococcus flavefaciens]MCM1230574.1 YqeG family HAD IIIA-type phosphatase [Ruminococcus flavefaciens]